MRFKPCWSDSLGLEILYGWLLAFAVAVGLLLVSECTTQPAHAGAYLDVAGGVTQFLITAPDGDYLQRSLPHSLDTLSMAYRVGAGWSFNERWSIQGGYVNFGTITQSAIFVGDENYNAKTSQCTNGCPGRKNYRITDAYHGGELTLTRSFKIDDSWAWHLKGGGAYLMHRFTLNTEDGSGAFLQHYGQFPATVIGAGGCFKVICLELDYYHGLGGSNGFMGQDQGWPLSKEFLVSFLSFKLPLS